MKTENTKLMRAKYREYKLADPTDNLFKFYTRPSEAKWSALEDCKRLMKELNGGDLRILSANGWAFTVGFECVHPKTGEALFAYITKDHNRFIKISDCTI